MKNITFVIVTLLLLGVYNCATIPPTFLQTDYENKPVSTIGILELKGKNLPNDEISEQDFNKVENMIIEEVLDRNYDVVLPIKFKGFGIDSEEDLTKKMIGIICEMEKVDAVLFSSISAYSDKFLGQHTLVMNFNLIKANGDIIWVDQVNLEKNGLMRFVGFVAGVTVATVLQPGDEVSTSTKVKFGLGIGALAGLLAEGITPYISGAISQRFGTLPEGSGQGEKIK